jgi:hypothetical protein
MHRNGNRIFAIDLRKEEIGAISRIRKVVDQTQIEQIVRVELYENNGEVNAS